MNTLVARPHPDLRALPLPRPRLGQAGDRVETLRRDGPVVTVEVGPPAGGQGTPQTVRAIIDTGASISAVTDEIAQAAGLVPTGSVELGGIGGSGSRPVYAAAMRLPEFGIQFDAAEVAGVPIPMPGVQMLIGRDMLRRMRLDYQGAEGAFLLQESGGGAALAPAGGGTWPILLGLGAAGAAVGLLFALDVL